MLKGAIARRYAEAMFQIALKQNTVDRTLEDVQGITQVFANRYGSGPTLRVRRVLLGNLRKG